MGLLCSTCTVDMESNVMISCLLLALIGSLEAVLWSSKNCNPNGDDRNVVRGKVTDAICCGSTHMAEAHSKCNVMDKNSCNAEDTCKWHDPSRNIKCRTAYSRLLPECQERPSCKLNRDSRNNVCCKNPELEKLDNCVDMMAGRCPSAWQVPRDCCPAPNDKYAFMLTTDPSRSDLVCCNAPCTAIEQAWRGEEGNVTAGVAPVPGKTQCRADGVQMPAAVKENCAPAKRSFLADLLGGGGGLGGGLGGLSGGLGGLGGGMDPSMISQLLGMPTGAGDSLDLGKVIPGMAGNTGLDGGATLAALQGLGFGSSKDSHVDEITVDDFFDAIIEALDNDKDVFEYNKEINSDSWFGKQSFGGLVDGFKFIDPKKFINRIYGSPFGLSNAQAMFGMQYGIPMNKFKKHTGMHQIMTGYANPYGPPPPSYHAPTPPPYSPPVYPGPIPEPHPEPVAEPVPEPEFHHPVYQPYPEPYPEPVYQPYPEPYPHPNPEPEYHQPVYQPYPQPEPEPVYYQPHPEPAPVYHPPQPEPEPVYYQPYPEPPPVYYPPQPEPEPVYYQPYPEPPPAYYPPHPEPRPEPYYPPHPQPEPYYPPQPEPYYPPYQPHPEPAPA